MNLANKLTLSRMLMVPLLVVCLVPERITNVQKITSYQFVIMIARHVALLVFVVAALTDYIDGKIARKYNMITNLGKLLDPLADKILVAAAFVAFVDLDIFPAWFVIVILFREFIVTGLRSLGTAQGRVIQADRWGKHKTLWQMLTILLTLVFLAMRDTLVWAGQWEKAFHGLALEWWFDNVLIRILMGICLYFTLLSGALYMFRNWDLVREEPMK